MWSIIDKFFTQSGDADCSNRLVAHQIQSMNEFLDKKVIQIIQGFNPIQICHNYSVENRDFKHKINLNILQPAISKPMFQHTDGSQVVMTPHLARMNNLTYSGNLYVDIHVTTETVNDDGVIERKETRFPSVCIGKIPIMVRSKACVLTQMPALAEDNGRHECRYDVGGYFIINGNEKVVISQDRISENKTLVFAPNGGADGLYAEIRSMPDGMFLPPKTTSLSMSGKANHMGNVIRLSASFLRSDIPLFAMFRALGVESDKDIFAYIVYDIDAEKNQRMLGKLAACAEDACDIHTQEDALNMMLKFLGTTGTPREYLEQPERAMEVIKTTIRQDFLSHVGHSYKKKALYLGYMVRKMLSIHLGYLDYDNRDSYIHKRIDTPGVLFSNLFRQCYGKLIKDVRSLIVRELNLWRANPNSSQVINEINIHRFFKQTVIETGLRYALSTGNWGVKSVGSFQNIRQGVAQVLNRMSYLSTLSHLRRINTPMEKNGKLVQPRKLENTQFGMICPAETPEGQAVGLVKNIAMSTCVTISISSVYVRKVVEELGTAVFGDNIDPIPFLKRMGADDIVYVMVNGDLVGFHSNPAVFYDKMKHYKRYGSIPPTTAIVWDVQRSTISISTEAGRMCRPLLIVDNGRELRVSKVWDRFKDKVFQSMVAPLEDDYTEGVIEYMDVDEIDKAMVAMFQCDLQRGVKGTTLPPNFTHCELHPSLLSGVLAANIPFMDHNQAPRNCYQCLWLEEPVKMADGTTRPIKNVKVGDSVVCFDTKDMVLRNTTVIHQYVRPTDKPVYKISMYSGRSIIATHDHKFMTLEGWCDIIHMNKNTKLGVLVDTPVYNNVCSKIETIKIDEDPRLVDMGLYPLQTDNKFMPLLARIVGYVHGRGRIGFEEYQDEERFDDDVKSVGFKEYGIRDSSAMRLIISLTKTQSEWLHNCSEHVKASWLAGYRGGVLDPLAPTEAIADFSGIDTSKVRPSYNATRAATQSVNVEYARHLEYFNKIRKTPLDFTAFQAMVVIKGDLLFMPQYTRVAAKNCMISDITVESDFHSFIGGAGFAVSNSAMGKQAVGLYMTNFNNRYDTMAHVLHYPQKTIVQTQMAKYTYADELPSATNAIVAIATHTGFNQEDSVMMNKAALDRGFMVSTYFKSYRDQCSKNHSTGQEEIFTKPDIDVSTRTNPYNYDKLGEDGFVPKDTYVDSNDVLVGKVMPHKVQGIIQNRDSSLHMKGNDEGHIDNTHIGINGEGYRYCKVRLRKYRKPVIGDKAASKVAQKGSLGMIYAHQDMPFTKDGIVPDIIMNPHAIPSRMTVGQLMECIMAKAGCHIGARGDCTPFTGCTVESIASVLEKSGYERYGNEILYCGRTGRQIQTEIFIGPTAYQRLKHMAADKNHARGSNGPIVMLTRQPAEGRARNGGLRFGEMERDAIVAHGASAFLKERMLDVSDNFRVFVCRRCGLLCTGNPEKNIFRCTQCKNGTDIVQVRIPYAMKLLMQELMSLSVAPRLSV